MEKEVHVINNNVQNEHIEANSLSEKGKELVKDLRQENAGFLLRFMARILDNFILNVARVILFFSALFGLRAVFPGDDNTVGETIWIVSALIILFVLPLVYYALMESSSKQATLGKMYVGLQVTDMAGNRISFTRALVRHIAEILSYLTFFIGYIISGFTTQKQALHDLIAGTLVVKKEK